MHGISLLWKDIYTTGKCVCRFPALLSYRLIVGNSFHLISDYKHRRLKREQDFLGSRKVCRLFVVADYEFHKNVGGNNKHTTARYMVNFLSEFSHVLPVCNKSKQRKNISILCINDLINLREISILPKLKFLIRCPACINIA